MGLTRRALHISSMGAINKRSRKARIVRNTAKTASATKRGNTLAAFQSLGDMASAKAQRDLLKEQNRLLGLQASLMQVTQAPPPLGSPPAKHHVAMVVTGARDVSTQLAHVAELHRAGALSSDEFAKAKSYILGMAMEPN
jgi:hypothetical protein